MARLVLADFNCLDEERHVWGFETDGVVIGDQVILTDGEVLVQAIIETSTQGSLVARPLYGKHVGEFFVPLPVRYINN